jgi:hypothetical protein
MSAAVATAPVVAPEAPIAPRLFEAGGETLEDAVLGTWDELVAGAHARCPVCAGEMTAARGCSDCGSELS